jgi:hypothetical protein
MIEKIRSVKEWLQKRLASLKNRKQIIAIAGLVIVTIVVIVGAQVYIHSHNQQVGGVSETGDSSNNVLPDAPSGLSGLATDNSSSSAANDTSSGISSSSAAPTTQNIAVQAVTISQSSISLKVGQTSQLTAAVSPDNASDKTVKWSSSDKYTASVSSSGVITGGLAGTAYIYAKSTNGLSAKCKVTVTSPSTGNGGNTGGSSSTGGGGSTGGSSSTGGGSSTGGSSSTSPTGNNLAGLATYGDYPYPYGVEETNPQFRQNEPRYDCNKIAEDITNQYAGMGYTFDTDSGNVFRVGASQGGAMVIRGKLSGEGQTHVVDVEAVYNGSTYEHGILVKLS